MLSGNCSFSRITSITSLRMSRLLCGSNPGITPYRASIACCRQAARANMLQTVLDRTNVFSIDENHGLRQKAGFVPDSGPTENKAEIKLNKNSILCLLTHSTSRFDAAGPTLIGGVNHDFRRLRRHWFCPVRFEAMSSQSTKI